MKNIEIKSDDEISKFMSKWAQIIQDSVNGTKISTLCSRKDLTAIEFIDSHIEEITFRDALIIGFAQSLALIPGTSRSGITISAGLFLGLDSKTASKFSFLMAVPTIGAIASYQLLSTDVEFLIKYFQINFIGLIVSFVIAYATIDFFIRFINRIGFLPFILYRIVLGIVLFSLILS